jgi:hypothetical protein
MRALAYLLGLSLICSAGLARAQQVHVVVPEVEVQMAPPAARVEVQSPRPAGGNYNWVPGYWAWRRNQHVWVAGHWAMPPQQGMVWEPARWAQRGPRWVFVEGHWRYNQPVQQVVYEPAPPPATEVEVVTEPPAPIVEVRPAMPFANAVWIPGYWHWNGGHHVWVGGRWSAPRAGWTWEPNHWERHGNGWVMRHGHWRH